MYGEIVFYTHGSTIEYGGEIFAAGELTADILNFTPQDYRPIQRLLARMKELARQYEATLERGIWWELNNHLIELRSQLMRYRVFQILLKEDDQFLNETQQYTESYSLFTDEEMDEKDCTLERCLDLYQKEEEEHRTPLFLLIVPGGREDKWRYYKLQMARYQRYIDDVTASSSAARRASSPERGFPTSPTGGGTATTSTAAGTRSWPPCGRSGSWTSS